MDDMEVFTNMPRAGGSRVLATLRIVDEVLPLPTATHSESATLELLRLGGWNVAVRRSADHKPNDLVLFFEIDSFLPAKAHPAFAHLQDQTVFKGERGVHVRTRMVNGKVCQGLVLPWEQFPEVEKLVADMIVHVEDAHLAHRDEGGHDEVDTTNDNSLDLTIRANLASLDLTSVLSVRKWTLDAEELGATLGRFPTFLPKTDMSRVQNCPNLFIKHKYQTMQFQESIKLDGSAMTAYFVRRDDPTFHALPVLPEDGSWPHAVRPTGRFGVCSRNNNLSEHLVSPSGKGSKKAANNDANNQRLYWEVALRLGLPEKLEGLGMSIAVQGELCAPTLRGGSYGCYKRPLTEEELDGLASSGTKKMATLPITIKEPDLPGWIPPHLRGVTAQPPVPVPARPTHPPPTPQDASRDQHRRQQTQALYLRQADFFVYSMYDVAKHQQLQPRETERRARELGLQHVPVRGYVFLGNIAKSHTDLIQRAEELDRVEGGVVIQEKGKGADKGKGKAKGVNIGKSEGGWFPQSERIPEEGLVFKNCVDGRWFKVLSNRYLLKYHE